MRWCWTVWASHGFFVLCCAQSSTSLNFSLSCCLASPFPQLCPWPFPACVTSREQVDEQLFMSRFYFIALFPVGESRGSWLTLNPVGLNCLPIAVFQIKISTARIFLSCTSLVPHRALCVPLRWFTAAHTAGKQQRESSTRRVGFSCSVSSIYHCGSHAEQEMEKHHQRWGTGHSERTLILCSSPAEQLKVHGVFTASSAARSDGRPGSQGAASTRTAPRRCRRCGGTEFPRGSAGRRVPAQLAAGPDRAVLQRALLRRAGLDPRARRGSGNGNGPAAGTGVGMGTGRSCRQRRAAPDIKGSGTPRFPAHCRAPCVAWLERSNEKAPQASGERRHLSPSGPALACPWLSRKFLLPFPCV